MIVRVDISNHIANTGITRLHRITHNEAEARELIVTLTSCAEELRLLLRVAHLCNIEVNMRDVRRARMRGLHRNGCEEASEALWHT
jgi:hypothetical protein